MSEYSDIHEPTLTNLTAPTPQPGVGGNPGIRVDPYDTINGLIQQNQMLMAQMAAQAQQMLQMQQQMSLQMNDSAGTTGASTTSTTNQDRHARWLFRQTGGAGHFYPAKQDVLQCPNL